jgi:pyruvate,orthophosphate dikinase
MKQADINLAEALVPFGGSARSVDTPDKAILGGKGLGLQEMSRIGVDVPPGFTLITPLCIVYEKQNDLPAEMWVTVKQAIKRVEADTGKKFGADENPLLFSCRSGAAISMPGMMDTVLNIVSQLKRHVFDNSDVSLIFHFVLFLIKNNVGS